MKALICLLALAGPALAGGIQESTLENGLTVLTLERHSAPVVSVQIWYRVGSADEAQGETGLAHFLEHLMFKGTDRYEKGEIDRITLEQGGSNNAGTYKDWTYFYFNFASDRFETALEIEANRMRNLSFDPMEFEAERKVILEELAIGRDGPWCELDETLEATAFLAHPYQHPVIGWKEDLLRIPREGVKAFYDAHYHPNHAALVLVGDFDTAHALELVRKHFGPIPAGPERARDRSPEPPQNGERRIEVVRDAELTRLEMVWHTIPAAHPDDVVLDVAASLLAGGRAAWLTRRLVDGEGLSTTVSASNDSRLDAGLFWVWTELARDADPALVDAAIRDEVSRLGREPVPDEELVAAKKSLRSARIFGRARAESCADEIGQLASTARWTLVDTYLDRLAAVTAEDVRRVAAEWLRDGNRTFGRARPAKRSSRTPAGGPVVELAPEVVTLPSGLTLIVARHEAVPVFALEIHAEGARAHEARPGLANLHARYLEEGTGGWDAQDLARALGALGAAFEASPSGLTARCLREDAPALVKVMSKLVRRPSFPEEAFPRLRQRIASEIRSEEDDPQVVGRNALRKAVYGTHPLATPDLGTEESVAAITREDVLAHHRGAWHPSRLVVVAVSDRPVEETVAMLREAFADWQPGPAPERQALPAIAPPAPRRIEIENRADQANIYVGHLGVRRDDPDYFPLLVMDFVLGRSPGFTDRLSRRLRDEEGLAYDLYASITSTAGTQPGLFLGFIGTAASQRDRAGNGLVEEIRRITEEAPTAEEVDGAKAYLTGSFVFGYETAWQLASRLVEVHRFGLGFDYPAKFAAGVNAVTPGEVLRVAQAHLFPDRLVSVVVGPKEE